jgi:ribosomal protein S25
MEQTAAVGLTGRQRLVYEACRKISEGERMQKDGYLELRNLIPEGKTIANRVLRESHQPFTKNNKPDDHLIVEIMKMIASGERVTANFVKKQLRITERHVARLRAKMPGIINKPSKGGGAHIWTLDGTKTNKTKIRSTSIDKNISDKILEYVKSNEWVTIHKIMEELNIPWYPAKVAINHLVSQNLVRSISKSGNPAHKKNVSSFARRFTYWESV